MRITDANAVFCGKPRVRLRFRAGDKMIIDV